MNAVFRRELRAYLVTPIGWIVVVGFLVFTSVWLFFIQDFFARGIATLREYFSVMPVVFIVLIPALTMRMWSEERKRGTDALLLTLPVSEARLVLGKFTAALVLLAAALACSLLVPLSLGSLGDFERGETLGQYLGLFLLGGAAISIGGLISALSTSQMGAFLTSAFALLVLTLLPRLSAVLGAAGPVAELLAYASLDDHVRSFNRGVIDTRDVGYFFGVTALCLHATVRVIVRRRAR